MARKVAAALGGSVRNKTLAVPGLTFKPDDMRETPSIALITALHELGARGGPTIRLEWGRPSWCGHLLRWTLCMRREGRCPGHRHRMGAVQGAGFRPTSHGAAGAERRRATVSSMTVSACGFFDLNYIGSLIEEYTVSRCHTPRLWSLLFLSEWLQQQRQRCHCVNRMIEKPAPVSPRPRTSVFEARIQCLNSSSPARPD
jgi:hypothetical protein